MTDQFDDFGDDFSSFESGLGDDFGDDFAASFRDEDFADEGFGEFGGEEPDLTVREGGISRSFIIVGILLAVVFVILVAIGAALILGRGGEECGPTCQQATEISGTNFAIQTEVAQTGTANFEQLQATENAQGTSIAQTATQEPLDATATQDSIETAAAATITQEAIDATATQAAANIAGTADALAQIPPTAAEVVLEGDVRDSLGEPVSGATICIFLDDGDGEFTPGSDATGDCSATALLQPTSAPAAPTAATGGATQAAPTAATGGGGPTLSPIFQTATAAAGGGAAPVPTEEQAEEPEDAATQAPPAGQPTTAPVNPIFQTATAAAAGSSGSGGGSTGGTGSDGDSAPPIPTQEEAGFNPDIYQRPVGRSIAEPDGNALPQQQPGGDEFIGDVTTNSQGHFVLPPLPQGEYWIVIAGQTIGFEVTSEPQLITVPRGEDEPPIVIEIPAGQGGQQATPTVDTGVVAPVFQTATALVLAQTASAQPPGATTVASPTALDDTGLFSGDSEDVTPVDLLILAMMGAVLIGVIFTARRMRTGV